MNEPIEKLATTPSDTTSGDGGTGTRGQTSMLLSVIGLVAGVIALGLAAIPAIALERALPNPFAGAKPEQPRAEPVAEREGGVNFKFKNIAVNIGGKIPEKKVQPEAPPEITKDPIRWLTISAIGCALLGLVVASVGHVRERHTALTVCSMGCCAAAITWQYVAIGIAVGAAAAAFLVVLAILGPLVN